MENIFAKILEFKNSQVLVTKQFEDDDDKQYQVVFETRAFEDFNLVQKLCFNTEEQCNEVFDKVDLKFINNLFQPIVESLPEEFNTN